MTAGWPWTGRDDVEFICMTKHPQQVMVLGILSSDGKRMPLIFFGRDKKCNSEVYYKILRYKVSLWLKRTYPLGNYIFQQDGAPAHTSKKVQNFLASSLAEFWSMDLWPPSSPDLNPLNFFWWSVIVRKVNATPTQILTPSRPQRSGLPTSTLSWWMPAAVPAAVWSLLLPLAACTLSIKSHILSL